MTRLQCCDYIHTGWFSSFASHSFSFSFLSFALLAPATIGTHSFEHTHERSYAINTIHTTTTKRHEKPFYERKTVSFHFGYVAQSLNITFIFISFGLYVMPSSHRYSTNIDQFYLLCITKFLRIRVYACVCAHTRESRYHFWTLLFSCRTDIILRDLFGSLITIECVKIELCTVFCCRREKQPRRRRRKRERKNYKKEKLHVLPTISSVQYKKKIISSGSSSSRYGHKNRNRMLKTNVARDDNKKEVSNK